MSWARPLCPSKRPRNLILATNNHQDQFRLEIGRLNKVWKRWEPFSPAICLLLQRDSMDPTLHKCWLVASLVFVCVSFSLHSTVWPLPPFYQAFLLGYRNLSACFYLRRGLAVSRIGTDLLQEVPRGPNLHATPVTGVTGEESAVCLMF